MRLFTRKATAAWDLTALLNAADPEAPQAERHLWLIRLLEWLRHAPLPEDATQKTPTPVLRLKHLLNTLDRNPDHRVRVARVLGDFWHEVDTPALFADFGFSPRMDFFGELGRRVRARVLPMTPATTDLGELFSLLFNDPADARWLQAIDDETLARLVLLVAPSSERALLSTHGWRTPLLDAIMFLASAVGAAGFSGFLRQRMSPQLLTSRPFRQLARVAEDLYGVAESGDRTALLQQAQYLRALLDTCRQCADSVHDHLEEHGVSIDVVFAVDQLRQRTHRIEQLLNCVLSTEPAREMAALVAELVRSTHERRSVRSLFAQHYSLLARKVAERSAATGEQYITRDRAAYALMLRRAAGGGLVLAGTTFLKFFLQAMGFTAFWNGFVLGVNYASSFVVVQLLHWTVATKQPAMTAPAMAEKLGDASDDPAVERFVDEVAHLIRSQAAGIIGNVAVVFPVVLAVQWACRWAFGAPAVGHETARHVLASLTLLGPTALYAAFTGVLLFASSLIAGWVENWFVWHRLDSAIAWNPRFVSVLGPQRAQRWALYWRRNISGFASNISLGFMLGLVPAVATFFALPIEVRHVTLSTGQIAAALGAEGWGLLHEPAFWWCLAGAGVTGIVNVGVSFFLAFKVALRSRGIRLADRSRIYRVVRRRLWRRPLSFIVPPKTPAP